MTVSTQIPPLVARALRASLELGYIETTRTETGRLLMTLAATRSGVIGECGSGCGVGAAWLRSGAPSSTQVVTAEIDADLAERARETLTAEGVEVIHAQFATLSDHGPFSLIYADMEAACDPADLDIAYAALEPGGIFVIDELEGAHYAERLSPDDPAQVARRAWLSDPRFQATEVYTAPDAPVLIVVKKG